MEERITPNRIESLKKGQIFVFGSNLSGKHGLGAAKTAHKKWGAIYGNSSGIQGDCYAIPTKDISIPRVLTIKEIKPYVDKFIIFALRNDQKTFLVTEIGCGLAGGNPKDIAPLFEKAKFINNIHLPKRFWDELNRLLNSTYTSKEVTTMNYGNVSLATKLFPHFF